MHLDPQIDLKEYAKNLDGFTGADLSAFMYNAHLSCIQQHLSSLDENVSSKDTKYKEDHSHKENKPLYKVWNPLQSDHQQEELHLEKRVIQFYI